MIEPLFCVAWRAKDKPDDAPADGRTRARIAGKERADAMAADANRQFPHTHHWAEEVSADDRS